MAINHYSRKHITPALSRLPVSTLGALVDRAAIHVRGRRTRGAMAVALAGLQLDRLVDQLLSLSVVDLRTIASGLRLDVEEDRESIASGLEKLVRQRKRFTQRNVLDYVSAHYLDSHDFNGCPVHNVGAYFEPSITDARALIGRLITNGQATVNFGDIEPNPHVQSLMPEPSAQQLRKLQSGTLEHVCIYPTFKALQKRLGEYEYANEPFARRMALGEPQLTVVSFRLEVLDIYRRDPRYAFDVSDVLGQISITEEGGRSLPAESQAFLNAFGFSYNDALDRAVCAFLCDLRRLTPEHQQIWRAHLATGFDTIHPGFYRTQVYGDWATHVSVFDAFLEEQKHINEMCQLMERPGLFRKVHDRKDLRNFSFLLRPTRSEFQDFVLTLDKLISDNIDHKFFGTEVLFVEQKIRDGVVSERDRGTIAVLDEWLSKKFRMPDPAPMREVIETFKKIRKLRQKPAHTIEQDNFDQAYVHKQRDLMRAAYTAVRTIRLIFKNHPAAADYAVPEYLYEGRIWSL